jgi:hypothetical protein
MTQKALKLALNALETCGEDEWHSDDDFGMVQIYNETMVNRAIAALKEALAQPEQEPVASSLVECVMSARKEFSAIKGESQFCTECHAFERADSWWQEWHGGDIDYITGAKYTSPPQRTEQEPVIDKSAAIRIATALGWTPPRTWVGL